MITDYEIISDFDAKITDDGVTSHRDNNANLLEILKSENIIEVFQTYINEASSYRISKDSKLLSCLGGLITIFPLIILFSAKLLNNKELAEKIESLLEMCVVGFGFHVGVLLESIKKCEYKKRVKVCKAVIEALEEEIERLNGAKRKLEVNTSGVIATDLYYKELEKIALAIRNYSIDKSEHVIEKLLKYASDGMGRSKSDYEIELRIYITMLLCDEVFSENYPERYQLLEATATELFEIDEEKYK